MKLQFEIDHNQPIGPRAQGMYDPALDHDSCGVGFVANVSGEQSRQIIDLALGAVCNLEHRGAEGADPQTGDGAGILMQLPHEFLRRVAADVNIELPEPGKYGVGFIFLPRIPLIRHAVETLIEKVIVDEGQKFLGWRDVPIDPAVPGAGARETMPYFRQCFIGAGRGCENDECEFERQLFMIRRVVDGRVRAEHKLERSRYYVASFSSKTIVYKGMLLGDQVEKFYRDLQAPDMKSALALFHTRFSTNTFPTWELAHPYRMIAHNGEINTLRGNINWMAARERVMESPFYKKNLRRMLPVVMEGQSDSATFDNVLELLHMGGRSVAQSIMMMIPEAWSKNQMMDPDLRAFYEYHATIMEPWDGPAAVAFTDGDVIGATLDRNGLRPARYIVTKDNMVMMASEAGTIHVDAQNILRSGRLQPGKMFLIDLKKGRIVSDEEIKREMTRRNPYRDWVDQNMIRLQDLPVPGFVHQPDHETMLGRQRAFGYSQEDLSMIIRPMAVNGEEPVGSMGADVALAVLSEKPQPLFRYFKQLFAQVTNPPVDAIREELVFELTSYIGPEGNLLDETPAHAHRLELEHPVLTNMELEKIRSIQKGVLNSVTINILFDPDEKKGMRNRLDQVCEDAVRAVREGAGLIILSDRGVAPNVAAIPSLLAVAGVHHRLIREGLRTKTGLLIESGEPREVSHFALLIGYGANAINPYLAFETLADLKREGMLPELQNPLEARSNYIKAIGKGLFKIFSKMGISTLQSYCGAQIFEAVGLDSELVSKYFTGTYTRIEGLTLEMLEEETLRRHRTAFDQIFFQGQLQTAGIHNYRKQGENHIINPLTIFKLQHSTRNNDFDEFREFTALINDQSRKTNTLRGLFDLQLEKEPLPLDEVESESEILKRFATGAMSFGSISWEVHTDMAIAMNRLGGKSNTGEGGEDPKRYVPLPNGDSMRSAIKQVASGRFGVDINYLVNADELQIKMAQGAKPGEGGQLPGHKVDQYIASIRNSTPGVMLISPPPHHDIYSIEDLKQLIFDLKNSNPKARISVKLVSETGVGTVAAGVAKAKADHILISGHDGGTGASPISSIHNAGSPWELGLSETHQTLVANGLRDRVYVAVDGKLMTGRDVVIGALLGADEFGFGTVALIVLGCIMLRKCHLNTCSVGVATQDPELRKKYGGKPEYLERYMLFVAREVRELMAAMGFRTFNEMIGRVDRVVPRKFHHHWKARGIDFGRVLSRPQPAFETAFYRTREQNHGLESQLDNELIERARPAIEHGEKVKIEMEIRNVHRTVGTMLSGRIAEKYGTAGLPDGTVDITMIGYAGQSFGAFICRGITLTLLGLSQDYCGKGVSGGRLIVRPFSDVSYETTDNILIGNTSLYGATSGEAYINGMAGERFCVRNSGVHAVVEGVGDHGCEYMTGGRVVILGETGRNFAAGMSGGIAYVWNPENRFRKLVNRSMVDLEPLDDPADIDEVLHLITRHREYTGSGRADRILADWDNQIERFIKVIPGEYKLALLKLEEEKAESIQDSPLVAGG